MTSLLSFSLNWSFISLNVSLSRRLPIGEGMKDIILNTHEKNDGTGFPNRFRGEKIPHEAVLTLTVGNGNETMPEDSALVNESGTANDDKPVVDESWF